MPFLSITDFASLNLLFFPMDEDIANGLLIKNLAVPLHMLD